MLKSIFAFLLCFSFLAAFSQIADKAENVSPLLIGEKIPDAVVVNGQNEAFQLKDILAKQPTVLVFFRGGWCPYCNLQLSALGQAMDEILQLGYQVVAISPENYQNIQPTIEKDKINYQVYSDPKAELLQKVGIAFAMSDQHKKSLPSRSKGELIEILPAPAVMVVNTAGEILFEYINPDFKKRISKELLLAALGALK